MKAPTPSAGRKKKYRVELSGVGIFFGSLGFVFVLGWIFVLGIMVGRGFVPEGVRSLGQMTEQLARLVTILGTDRDEDTAQVAGPGQETALEFYDRLARAPSGGKSERVGGRIPAAPAPPAAPPAVEAPSPSPEPGKWVVQVASLDSEPKALELTEKLKTLGYPAYTYKTIISGTPYHRVRCGPFESRSDAEAARQRLSDQHKVNGFLTTLDQ